MIIIAVAVGVVAVNNHYSINTVQESVNFGGFHWLQVWQSGSTSEPLHTNAAMIWKYVIKSKTNETKTQGFQPENATNAHIQINRLKMAN